MGAMLIHIERLSKGVESGEAWKHRTTEQDISFDKDYYTWSFIEGLDLIDFTMSNLDLLEKDYAWARGFDLGELYEAMNSAGLRMLGTLEEYRYIFEYFPCTVKWAEEHGIDLDA
jgi:hypothetical protein